MARERVSFDSRHVVRRDGCWPWTGTKTPAGYPMWTPPGERAPVYAHRYAYERFIGPIPDGLEIDHTCHTRSSCPGGPTCPHRACVNPAHLEAVTHRENVLRGRTFAAANAAKTECSKGHPLDEGNLYMEGRKRHCRTCRMAATRRAYAKRKEATRAVRA